MSDLDIIKNVIYNKIINFLDTQGITITLTDLQQNIHISNNDIKPKIKFKPKKTNKSSKKIKFKPKPKSTYTLFIDICKSNNFNYFKFNDEYDWTGPAIKINDSDYDTHILLFNKFKYNEIKGTGFTIIRPTIFEKDSHINYDLPKPIYNKSTTTFTSDDEEDIETEEWEFRNNKYLLDKINNDIYSIDTYDIIGKRIFSEEYDDYIIEFN